MSKVRAEQYTNRLGTGAPEIPYGVTVPEGASIDGAGGLNLTGIATAGTFKGDLNGNVTGVAATFTGPVTIGGTLTYEDVTNIDSVGLITARDGIHISGNIGLGGATYGTAGQVLTSGGSGANATWTTISAAPEHTGITSGSITAGRGVCVADDGKLLPITGFNGSRGTDTRAQTNNMNYFDLVYSTGSDKFVMFYRDESDSNKGKASVGTQNGTTITWGTPVEFSGTSSEYIRALYDSYNDKVVVAFRDTTNTASVVVGTISGTSITFGSKVMNVTGSNEPGGGGSLEYMSLCYCDQTYNYALAYNSSSGNKGWCRIGKYAATNSSTWTTTAVKFQDAQARNTGCWFDTTANKLIIATNHDGDSQKGYAYVGTVANDDVTFVAGQMYDSSTNTDFIPSGCHDPNTGKNVFCYGGTQYHGYARTGTLSGNTLTFGDQYKFANYSTTSPKIAYDSQGSKRFLIAYSPYRESQQWGETIVATVSGSNVITYDAKYVFSDDGQAGTTNPGLAYSPDTKSFVTLFRANSSGNYFVENIRTSNMTAGNYVGIANASYTNGQTASIAIPGAVNTAVSGLTVGQKYYVLADGTLSTTSDNESIVAGNSVAANKLIIR